MKSNVFLFKMCLLPIGLTLAVQNYALSMGWAAANVQPNKCSGLFGASSHSKSELDELISNLRKNDLGFRQYGAFRSFTAAAAKYPFAYRGFSMSGFGLNKLKQFIKGDRNADIRSWDYSRFFESTGSSNSFEVADKAIEAKILSDLLSKGLEGYLRSEMSSTHLQINQKDRKATSLNMAHTLPESLLYAFWGFEEEGSRPEIAVVLKVATNSKKLIPYLPNNSFYLSHINGRDVAGIFVGFPNVTDGSFEFYSLDKSVSSRSWTISYHGNHSENNRYFTKNVPIATVTKDSVEWHASQGEVEGISVQISQLIDLLR